MAAIMLIELWERLRGYDKWVQTEAKIKSATEQTTEEYYKGQRYEIRSSNDELVWTDAQGVEHISEFGVPEDSPLFQMIGGETVTIRYDPEDPERFFFPDLMRGKAQTFVRNVKILLLLIALIAGPGVIFVWVFGGKR
jgi:hypothetical protein